MRTDPNIPDPDGFYAALVAAHEGLTEAQSAELNARLVFLLANQVGDQAVLGACIDAAARGFRAPASSDRHVAKAGPG
jgi:hypothetical protein